MSITTRSVSEQDIINWVKYNMNYFNNTLKNIN